MAKKRKVTRRIDAKRASRKVSASVTSSSDWLQSIFESQTGKTIVAEMLVAAAGAAAAVLISEKGRTGAQSIMRAGRDAASQARQKGASAGLATADALGKAVERAGAATDIAAKAVGLKREPTQRALAEKALEMRKEGDGSHPSRPSMETYRRVPSRDQ